MISMLLLIHDEASPLTEFFEEPILPHNAAWNSSDEEIGAFWNF